LRFHMGLLLLLNSASVCRSRTPELSSRPAGGGSVCFNDLLGGPGEHWDISGTPDWRLPLGLWHPIDSVRPPFIGCYAALASFNCVLDDMGLVGASSRCGGALIASRAVVRSERLRREFRSCQSSSTLPILRSTDTSRTQLATLIGLRPQRRTRSSPSCYARWARSSMGDGFMRRWPTGVLR